MEFAVRFAARPPTAGRRPRHVEPFWPPTVGALHEWGDPLPGVVFALQHLRHPRAFVRPFITDSELLDSDVRKHEDQGAGGRE